MKLRYLKGLFETHDLHFVRAENVFGDYWTIELQIPYPMKWEAGQHGAFTLPGKRVTGMPFRAFTVASAPSEKMILLGTHARSPISSFKHTLTTMQKGDVVRIRGPLGWFVVRDATSPIVLLAMGVGITPARSILYSLKDDMTRPLILVHTSSDFHLFSEELKALEKNNSQMQLAFVQDREQFRQSYTSAVATYGQTALYYVSGASHSVRSVKKALKGLGIKGNRIITEGFMGYHAPKRTK
ncbi:FAD-dependent oxidoreductase [Sphaerochaeta sp. PS]|uniref:FAD-dependent oxidoreductase n=1 Tax=Sphaerochaeta sp. PS TaxID=3076336 RepID=UPI0028A4F0DC|nr:FAD-dependent oxidoreductase [Sphaerochaeta sp. PS]MDT4762070.1 FAD-dependent oxidoreductase [Sphaerochaeta sp. PS]